MTTTPKDIRAGSLLHDHLDLKLGAMSKDEQAILSQALNLAESVLERTRPQTSLVDRMSWTGTSFADDIGIRYDSMGMEFNNMLTPVLDLSAFGRLINFHMETGYQFFDFEDFIVPISDEWDFMDEMEFVDDQRGQRTSGRGSLFSSERKTKSLSPRAQRLIQRKATKAKENALKNTRASQRRLATLATPPAARTRDAQEVQQLDPQAIERHQQSHVLNDVRLNRGAMPALSVALDRAKATKVHEPRAATTSLTRAVDFLPFAEPTSRPFSGWQIQGADIETPYLLPLERESMVEAGAQARRPARRTSAPMKATAILGNAPAVVQRKSTEGSSVSAPIQWQFSEIIPAAAPQPTISDVVADLSGQATGATFEPSSAQMSTARPKAGTIRPWIPIPELQQSQPKSMTQPLLMQDVALDQRSLPALAAGASEAAGQLGLSISNVSPASNFSIAQTNSMFQTVTLDTPGMDQVFTTTPMYIDGEDQVFVQPIEFDTPQAERSGRAAKSAQAAPPTRAQTMQRTTMSALFGDAPKLQALVSPNSLETTQPSSPGVQPKAAAPLEQEIFVQRALGSHLAMALGAPESHIVQSVAMELIEDTTDVTSAAQIITQQSGAQGRQAGASLQVQLKSALGRLPETIQTRAELAGWTTQTMLDVLRDPVVAREIQTDASNESSFWTTLMERHNAQSRTYDLWSMDGFAGDTEFVSATEELSFDDAGEIATTIAATPATPKTQAPTSPMVSGTMNQSVLKSILTQAVRDSGIQGSQLVPQMIREIGQRTDPVTLTKSIQSVLIAKDVDEIMSQPDRAGKFTQQLAKAMRSHGIQDTTLLSLPSMISEASAQSTETTSTPAAETGKDASSAVRQVAKTARVVGRAIRSMLSERWAGVATAADRWEHGPSVENLDSFVGRLMEMPMVQKHLDSGNVDGAIQASSRAILDFEHADATFVQNWVSDAFSESVIRDVNSGARATQFQQSPGAALDLSFGKMLAKPGMLSARLRALVSAKPEGQGQELQLADVFGWDEQALVEQQGGDTGGTSGVGRSGGARASRQGSSPQPGRAGLDNVRPGGISAPKAPSVPLGLEPTGTSIDVGRLAHTMLRPGVAPEADFNLVAPVSVAIAQAAHLSDASEEVGNHSDDGGGSAAAGQTPKSERDEIPEEVIEVLAMKIAGQISRQMKFEQDRSGQWDC